MRHKKAALGLMVIDRIGNLFQGVLIARAPGVGGAGEERTNGCTSRSLRARQRPRPSLPMFPTRAGTELKPPWGRRAEVLRAGLQACARRAFRPDRSVAG